MFVGQGQAELRGRHRAGDRAYPGHVRLVRCATRSAIDRPLRLIQMAAISTSPVTIGVRNGLTPISVKPLAITPVISAPMTVPTIVPRPPNRFVPPSTTAAITVSSKPSAELAEPEPSRAAVRMPAAPAARPVSISVIILILRVFTPALRTDSSCAPIPLTY